ncbi:imm11 family protein [Sphingomicrobium aestuariivivum]|uniref:imm11 family protein n=1 Tax=Sphingomicrobium aestuariivivum TaxID=1582356 RepID=UPI0031453FE4
MPPGFDLTAPPRLVFSAAKIGGAHMWCDKHLSMGVFISDELKAAFDEAGLTGIEPKPVDTVSASDEAKGPPAEARKGLLKRLFS